MRRLLLTLPAAVIAALASAAPAMAAVPTADYSLYNSDTSFMITVVTNPSNYGVQAEARCVLPDPQGYAYYYGPWVFSPGAVSVVNTPCDANFNHGSLDHGYFRYKKSAPIRVTCWYFGLPRNGSC